MVISVSIRGLVIGAENNICPLGPTPLFEQKPMMAETSIKSFTVMGINTSVRASLFLGHPCTPRRRTGRSKLIIFEAL